MIGFSIAENKTNNETDEVRQSSLDPSGNFQTINLRSCSTMVQKEKVIILMTMGG